MSRWKRRKRLWPRHYPRILSDRARHKFVCAGAAEPDNPWCFEVFMDCARCGQHRRVLRQDFDAGRYTDAAGCAGHRFRGRYRSGDHVDVDNMRYVFMHLAGGASAFVAEMGTLHVYQFPIGRLEPVLAGRDEAEKRRLRHLCGPGTQAMNSGGRPPERGGTMNRFPDVPWGRALAFLAALEAEARREHAEALALDPGIGQEGIDRLIANHAIDTVGGFTLRAGTLRAVAEDSRRLNSSPRRVEYRLTWFVDPSQPGADEPWFAEDDTGGVPEPGGVKHAGFFTSLSRAREYRDRIVVPDGGTAVRLESSEVIEVATPWKAVEET